jgi:hypothetical protein
MMDGGGIEGDSWDKGSIGRGFCWREGIGRVFCFDKGTGGGLGGGLTKAGGEINEK